MMIKRYGSPIFELLFIPEADQDLAELGKIRKVVWVNCFEVVVLWGLAHLLRLLHHLQ